MSVRNPSAALAVPPEAADHCRGQEHARVVLVEYGDFECPDCRIAARTAALLLERHVNRVRFIYRHFPLETAHPNALLAAEASEAAAAQGKFWQMHDRLFAHQGHLTAADLRKHAEAIGLDMARYTAEMDDHIYLQRVREHRDGGRASHVRGTPTFFVGGALQDTAAGTNALEEHVARAVAHAYP